MKYSTLLPLSTEQLTSTGTSDTKTATIPNDTSAVLISVETTDARVTFNSGDTPASSLGQLFPKALAPVRVDVGAGATIKVQSTASANSVVNLTYLR